MGFKRPLVQLQSLGPSKTVVTVWRLFFRLGDRDQRPLANSNPPLGVPNAKRRHAAGSTPVTRTNMNSRHSGAAVFSLRRKGTGGKFKFATDLPDIVLTCALQQNRQTKAHKFANFHYLSGKQNVVEYLTKRAIARSFPTMPVLRAAPRPSIR